MSKSRWLISILILVVALGLLLSLLFFRSYRAEPQLSLSVDELPHYVTAPIVVVSGRVSREAKIEVSRDSASLATVTSQNNKFEVEVELEPGENKISVSARPTVPDEIVGTGTTFTIHWEPRNPPVPTIHPLPPTTNLPVITVTGLAYPNGVVELMASPEVADRFPLYQSATANKEGTFATKLRLPDRGTYKITANTRNSNGVKSATSAEIKTVYDPDWYPPLPTQSARHIIRKADFVLRHKQMTMTYEVTLPKDDPAVTALMANQGSLSDFFEDIFGLTVNNYFYPADLDNVVPEVVYKDQFATIKATTLPHHAVRDFLPVLRGEITLAGSRGFPFSSPDDRLSITTSDYTVEPIGQPPTHVERNRLSWTGGAARDAFAPPIKLKLAYNPFSSPRNFLRLAQVSPYNLWQYPGNTIPHLLLGLFRLIPMLWVIWLVADWPLRYAIDGDLRNDLYKLSGTLITLSLIDTILNTSRGLAYLGWQYDVHEQLGVIQRLPFNVEMNRPLMGVVAPFVIFLLALLLQAVTAIFARYSWAIWIRRVSRGIRNAALVCVLVETTLFLSINPTLTRIPNMLILAVALGYLFFRTAQVIRHAEPTPEHKRRLSLLVLIIVIIFLVPSALTTSSTGAQWSIPQLFSMLDSLLPYALAIGLLIVLKRVDLLNQKRHRHVVLTIGLILFAGFLVGTTSNLFMIPVPFIIAIWMYRHALVYDFSTCGDLDYVNEEVIRDRRRLIDGVLTNETAQHFYAHIEKLKDKVTSGDVTPKDFEERKREIEQYANDKEAASTHDNGLHAKTTVLSIGPHFADWRNGRWCLRWARWLIAPFLLGYLLLLLLRPTAFSESVFGFMFGFNQLLTFVADWLLAAFFFGYFFRYIQGHSGLGKGLRTALVMIICLLPSWLSGLSGSGGLIGFFFGAGQTFLFFTLLGMGAFDYATFRRALRDQFRWRTFARFGNMPSFTAVASVLLGSIGVVLSSVFTDQFTDLLTNLLGAVLQQAPGPPK